MCLFEMLREFVLLSVCVFVCLLVGWLVCAVVFDLCVLCAGSFSCVLGLFDCWFDGLLSLDLFLIVYVCLFHCLLAVVAFVSLCVLSALWI